MKRASGHLKSWLWLCTSVIALSAGNANAASTRIRFDIPSQDLTKAISRFGVLTNMQVLYDPSLSIGKNSRAVDGHLSRDQAIGQLLADTGLSYQFTSDNVLLIYPKPGAQPQISPVPVTTIPQVPSVVIVTALKARLTTSMSRKRGADHIVETVVADDIGKFPDANLAESLQRVPGISISRSHGEGYQVTVRGFGPEFNTVLLDGAILPSRNAGREFNFNDLASDFISATDVYKTTPLEFPSGGIGATINIKAPMPFDLPHDVRTINLAGTIDSGQGSELKPILGAMVSQRFLDGKLGLLASFSRQSYVSHEDSVSIAAWKRDTAYLPGAIDESLDTTRHIYTPQNWMMGMQDVRRTRTNARLVMQVRPSDTLDFDVHVQYSNLLDELSGASLGTWFTTNDPSTAQVRTNANGTVLNYYQKNALDLDAENNVTRTVDVTDGFNVRWRPLSTLQFSASADMARSVQNPNGELEHNETDVGFANQTQFVLGARPDDLPYIQRYDERLPDRVQNGGAPGTGDSYLDPSNLRPHIVTRASDNVRDLIDQVRFRSEWSPPGFRLRAGLDAITRTKDVRTLNDDSNWCVYCGYPANPDLPDSLFTRQISVPSNFINGFGNGGLLPPRLIAYSADAVAGILEQASGVSLAPVDSSASYKVRERTLGGFVEIRAKGHLLGRPVTVVGGTRYETSDVSAQGTELPLSGLTYVDMTLENAVYGPAAAKQAANHYGYWLPALDARMDITDQVVGRIGVSRTLTRAPISALTPTLTINVTRPGNFAASGGNPNLRPYTSDNLDLSVEWYYSKSSYLSVDVFRKHVEDFITTQSFVMPINGVLDPSTGSDFTRPDPSDTLARFVVSRPINDGSANITGEEFALQNLFGDSGFGVIGNLTLVATNRPFDVRQISQTTAITGLSNSANLIGYYERGPLQARVAINWRDGYLSQIGQAQDAYEPTFVNPYAQVDASLSYKVTDKAELYGYATNLTRSTLSSHGRFKEQFLNATSGETRLVTGVRLHF